MTDKIAILERIRSILAGALVIDIILLFGYFGYGIFINYAVEVFLALIVPLPIIIPSLIVIAIILKIALRKERLSPTRPSEIPKVKSYSQSKSAMLSELDSFSSERGIGQKPRTEVPRQKYARDVIIAEGDTIEEAVIDSLVKLEKSIHKRRTENKDIIDSTTVILPQFKTPEEETITFKYLLPAFKSYHMAPEMLEKADLRVIELLENGKLEEAESLVEDIISDNPDKVEVHNLKAIVLLALDKEEEGLKAFEEGLKLDPKDPDLLITKAMYLGNRGNFGEEVYIYNKILDENPDNSFALANRGYAYFQSGEHEKAIENYNRALKVNPNLTIGWEYKGVYLLSYEKNYKEALVYFDKATELDPEAYKSWYNKGAAFERLGMYKESYECIDKATKFNPEDDLYQENRKGALGNYTNTILNEAKTHFMSGRFSDAIKCYDEVLELNPNDTTALLNKGNALSELGKHEEALQYNEEVLKIDPKYSSALFNKANDLVALRRFKESISSYDEALKIAPNKPNYWTNKGYAYQQLKDYDKAIECYNEALSIDPNFAPAIKSKTRALTEKRSMTFKP